MSQPIEIKNALSSTLSIGGSVIVSSGAITETNSGTISSTLTTLNGKVTACNTGAVVVSSGSITETNSGTISSTLTTLNGKVTACNTGAVVVSSGSITETNSGTISSTLTTLDGKVTACNTGAVTIASQSKTTSSITTWENPSSVISFDSNGSIPQNIKASSGSLISMSIFNNAGGNAIGYLAVYDSLAANVTVGVTTPKFVLALNHNVSIEIPCHNLQFSTAISYYVATTYGGAIHLGGIYLTAFYDN